MSIRTSHLPTLESPDAAVRMRIVQAECGARWDRYVRGNPSANPYHYYNWQEAIEQCYGYGSFALAAVPIRGSNLDSGSAGSDADLPIAGILPLVHLKSPLSGSHFVSMPYFDHGGVLADDPQAEAELIKAAVSLGRRHKVSRIELRQLDRIACLHAGADHGGEGAGDILPFEIDDQDRRSPQIRWSLRSHKARMVLELPGSSEGLNRSFKSKLRSQIQKPIKAGLQPRIGGVELLDDFYRVFAINMHELGSPVHSKALPGQVLRHFPETSRVVVIYKKEEPVAASIMAGFGEVMINPWSSALRRHSHLSPNMLLYWTMLAYACDNGYRCFDFGRSTPGEGTFRFKTQWGAQARPMFWYTIWLNGAPQRGAEAADGQPGPARRLAVQLWRRLPLFLSRLLGPRLRKHIDL